MSDSHQKSRRAIGGLSEESYELDSYESRVSTKSYRDIGEQSNESWKARFIEFFEFSPIPFFVVENSVIGQANLSACELVGKGMGKIVKMTFKDFFQNPEIIDPFLKNVQESSTSMELVTQLKNGKRTRIHATRFVENTTKIRIALTQELTDPRDRSRLRHIMLAAKDAFCIFDISGVFSTNNRASRVLLEPFEYSHLEALLNSLDILERLDDIDRALEHKNIWRKPVSIQNEPYLLIVSHIYCESLNSCEFLVKISPLQKLEHLEAQTKSKAIEAISERASTPLTVIFSAASLLRTLDSDSEAFEKVLNLLEENAKVLKGLAAGLNSLSNRNMNNFQAIPLRKIFEHSINTIHSTSPQTLIELKLTDPNFEIWAEPTRINDVFTKILQKTAQESHSLSIEVQEKRKNLNVSVLFRGKALSDLELKQFQYIFKSMGAELTQLNGEENLKHLRIEFLKGA